MHIFLTILKVIGIVLLVLLAIVLIILLLAMFVPFRYKVRLHVNDPEEHEEIPFKLWKDNAGATVEVSWLLNFFRAQVLYPGIDNVEIRILGKRFPVEKFLKKEEEEALKEEEKPPEEDKSLPEKVEALGHKIDKTLYGIDYFFRSLTGPCGRRAFDAALPRLWKVLLSTAPTYWSFNGTVGLGDPYRNGKLCEVCSMLYPYTEDRLTLTNSWLAYRMDVSGEMIGGIVLGAVVGGFFPLLFDKNCRKLLKMIRRGKARIRAYEERNATKKDGGQNG